MLGWVPSNASRDQAYAHLNARVPGAAGGGHQQLLARPEKANGQVPTLALPLPPPAAPWCAPADELKYDLHVLLVNHGKACPACAKPGSARHKAAAASGAAAACPLAGLKPPPSQLKAVPSAGGKKPRQGGAAAAAGGKAAKRAKAEPASG